MSGLRARQFGGGAGALTWALAASLGLHICLLQGAAPVRVPASALSRMEVRLAPSFEEQGQRLPGAAARGGASVAASAAERGHDAARELAAAARAPHARRASVGVAPEQAPGATGAAPSAAQLVAAAQGMAPEPVASGAAVPLESDGARLVLPQGVRAVYRQVAGAGQRELVWRLESGHYSLHWTERREDGAVVRRSSTQGLLSYAGLLPANYREVRAGQPAQELRFDWAAGVVDDGRQAAGAALARIAAGDQDPASLFMQVAVVHQVVAEAQRRGGLVIGVAGVGEVSARQAVSLDAPERVRYELRSAGAAMPAVAIELAAEHGFLPSRFEEAIAGARTVWQLAAVENLGAE
jgi:hypothetical protein